MQMARATALGGEPLPHHLGVGKYDRHVHLARDVSGLIVIAFYKARDELGLVHIEAFVQDKLACALHSSLSHHEDAGARDGLLAVKAYEVEIDPRGEHDLLSIVQAIDDLEPTLDAPRALKVKRGRRLCHVFLKLIRELATLTGQEALDTAHILGVLVR